MIKPKFTTFQLRENFKKRMDQVDQAILSRLTYIGETFINDARKNGNYSDVTGNLRSSIGYVVLKDGKKKAGSGFDKYAGGAEGQKSGKAFAAEIMKKYNTGYALIVVAGMDYASAVESKGKDVLTGSTPAAKAALRKAFKGFRG